MPRDFERAVRQAQRVSRRHQDIESACLAESFEALERDSAEILHARLKQVDLSLP